MRGVAEATLHAGVAWGIIAVAALTFALLFFVTAPYGRHGRQGWGPTMPTRWAWVVMESPAVLVWLGIYLLGDHRFEIVPLVFLGLWQLHYVHRTFVFPFRLRADGKRTPVLVAALAIVFNLFNAYVNARWVSHLGHYDLGWLRDPRFVVGIVLFLGGRRLNHWADAALIALREKGDGYQIPRGGLYRYVSCPNYLGEVIEWTGWALATWSLAGLSFAVFTFANLVPRAVAHHRWYHETFEHYPPERKAWLPFLW